MKERSGPPLMPQRHQTAGCASHAPLPHHPQIAVQGVRSLGITRDYRGALLGSPIQTRGSPDEQRGVSPVPEAWLSPSASACLRPAGGRR